MCSCNILGSKHQDHVYHLPPLGKLRLRERAFPGSKWSPTPKPALLSISAPLHRKVGDLELATLKEQKTRVEMTEDRLCLGLCGVTGTDFGTDVSSSPMCPFFPTSRSLLYSGKCCICLKSPLHLAKKHRPWDGVSPEVIVGMGTVFTQEQKLWHLTFFLLSTPSVFWPSLSMRIKANL